MRGKHSKEPQGWTDVPLSQEWAAMGWPDNRPPRDGLISRLLSEDRPHTYVGVGDLPMATLYTWLRGVVSTDAEAERASVVVVAWMLSEGLVDPVEYG
jgi:hypothetical protein